MYYKQGSCTFQSTLMHKGVGVNFLLYDKVKNTRYLSFFLYERERSLRILLHSWMIASALGLS